MGTAASTRCHVKNITNDLNSPDWFESNKRHGRNSIPVIGNIFSKGPARPPPAQIRKDKVSLIKRAIKAESNARDSEVKIKILERQLRTIELRNHDLSTELAWVKQQKPSSALKVQETPFNTEDNLEIQKPISQNILIDNLKFENKQLKDASDSLMATEIMKDLKISDLERENEEYRQRVTHLEELYRDKIGDHSLASASPSPVETTIFNLNSAETFNSSLDIQKDIINNSLETSHDCIKVECIPPIKQRRASMSVVKHKKSINDRRSSLPKGFPEESTCASVDDVSHLNDILSDEDDDFGLKDILNISVRSTSKSVCSQSGKSRDSGYSLSESTSSNDRSGMLA